MLIEVSEQDIEVIRTSLRYSILRVSAEVETPEAVRKENLERLNDALQKLSRAAANGD